MSPAGAVARLSLSHQDVVGNVLRANRAKERQISKEDLFELAEWKAGDPDVPDGDWYKDFGTFKLCGAGKFPSTFLLPGQAARGKRL